MAFVINKCKTSIDMQTIATALKRALQLGGRFIADITSDSRKVTIRKVRLTYRKDYCGNHPLPCPVRAVPRRHPVNTLLEGADWVGFNDMINDVLDTLGVDCDAGSSHVKIRKNGARCVRYDAQPLRNGIDNEWVKDSGAFENHMHREHKHASYPEGTPGFATYSGQPNYPENHH